jgi:hypothetical protein
LAAWIRIRVSVSARYGYEDTPFPSKNRYVDTFFKIINIVLIMVETITKVVVVSFCTKFKYATLLEHNIESRGYKRG